MKLQAKYGDVLYLVDDKNVYIQAAYEERQDDGTYETKYKWNPTGGAPSIFLQRCTSEGIEITPYDGGAVQQVGKPKMEVAALSTGKSKVTKE